MGSVHGKIAPQAGGLSRGWGGAIDRQGGSALEMSSRFLYEQWLETARGWRGETALLDLAAERRWTFEELRQEGERQESGGGIAYPRGAGPDFIFELLRAWRRDAVGCPLEASQGAPEIPPVPENIAHLKLTSASTGRAKCIGFTGAELAADAANIVATMGLTAEAPNLACISLAHSYGFSNLVLPLLLHGIPLALAPAPLPEVLLKAAKQFDFVTIPAVPALWKMWSESNSIPPKVKIAISAGAPLPLELERNVFEKRGLKIHNFYGSSECGGIAYDRTNVPRSAGNCVGAALEGVRLSVGSSGTLVIESEAVGESYFPEGDASLGRGRFESADLAEICDGQIFLQGRASDLLNIAGRKASPESIELILRTHPAVIECVIFGIQDSDDRADTVVAAVRTRTEVAISEFTQFLSEKIPAWQIPRRWWFTEELGTNSRGKISRAEWRRSYLEGQRS